MGGAPRGGRFPVEMRRVRPSDYESQKPDRKENPKDFPDKLLKIKGKRGIILLRDIY